MENQPEHETGQTTGATTAPPTGSPHEHGATLSGGATVALGQLHEVLGKPLTLPKLKAQVSFGEYDDWKWKVKRRLRTERVWRVV